MFQDGPRLNFTISINVTNATDIQNFNQNVQHLRVIGIHLHKDFTPLHVHDRCNADASLTLD